MVYSLILMNDFIIIYLIIYFIDVFIKLLYIMLSYFQIRIFFSIINDPIDYQNQ
jgi:hypothetical protein